MRVLSVSQSPATAAKLAALSLFALAAMGCAQEEREVVEIYPSHRVVLVFPDSILEASASGEDVVVSAAGSKLIVEPNYSALTPDASAGFATLQTSSGERKVYFRVARDTVPVSRIYMSLDDTGAEQVRVVPPSILPLSRDTTWVHFPAPVARLDADVADGIVSGSRGSTIWLTSNEQTIDPDGVLATVVLTDSLERLIPLVLKGEVSGTQHYDWAERPQVGVSLRKDDGSSAASAEHFPNSKSAPETLGEPLPGMTRALPEDSL